ncbi:hypothetical protein BT93_H2924 [Corymbia citriodora subsp. variegata]|nr:hypothetical protein BT93_H2924 [Corymbia citriodora subsp. variegata]
MTAPVLTTGLLSFSLAILEEEGERGRVCTVQLQLLGLFLERGKKKSDDLISLSLSAKSFSFFRNHHPPKEATDPPWQESVVFLVPPFLDPQKGACVRRICFPEFR